MSWTIDDVLAGLPESSPSPSLSPLPTPPYRYWGDDPRCVAGPSHLGTHVALAVASMKDHMTDEGWQLMQGLDHAGYNLWGHDLRLSSTDLDYILETEKPEVVFVQDKREWMGLTADRSRDEKMRFRNVKSLSYLPSVFRVTVIKDAQNDHLLHVESASEMGCHAWVCYYHPRVVSHLCPFVRPEHLVRTYHTIDPSIVPPYSPSERRGAVISGAVSGAYPLRSRLVREVGMLPQTEVLPHPGYHRKGCQTPEFIKRLSRYKVAICTASRYGYALRKMVEATAAGCVVVTDLPEDDELPVIDGNLVRIRPDYPTRHIANVIRTCIEHYDPDRQRQLAAETLSWYDYRREGQRLSGTIECLRENYPEQV